MSNLVLAPAGYVPQFAVSFENPDGTAAAVSASVPLPIAVVLPTTAALAGSASTSGVLGPYAPVIGRSVILALAGNWSGSVQVLRSTDGGATKLPLTVGGAPWALFTVNCCESVWDEGDLQGQLYLQVTLSAGTLTYRMAQ